MYGPAACGRSLPSMQWIAAAEETGPAIRIDDTMDHNFFLDIGF
jgi:hypothetical protein